jgi:hypothetical protein
MSRSRYTRWSDSALLFAVKARDQGLSAKQIGYQVNRGEKAVIEALRKYDAEQAPANGPDHAQVLPQSCGSVLERRMEMPTQLKKLSDLADEAGAEFDRVCLKHYPDARWGGYRAIECDTAPAEVIAAMEAYHAATQAFYSARDGDRGFLGVTEGAGAL